ncbi:DNA repair and recombination radC [Lecanosticta acicola]|uniref:RAD52 homolog n=1 Tax=Lecanosticta acicola TaxID=111012 RepID=A0AAI8Z8M3_9PEZI|nr:DNA repair and recombination radC [Lecanosticta acicola]
MPAPGDQHRDTPASVNPFLEHKPHINEFTAQEVATLQSRLDKQLGPEYISTRPGNGGGKVHYLAAEKVINLANEVFGFNGWSSSIQNVQIDFVDENPENGRINLGLSTIVRVTLRDGTFHEDIGYGHCENTKGKAAAFEKAKKEAATDAMKRALRNFGNVLGNCLYDKDYLQKVTKVKVAPSKWDAENLHRHPDFAPVKKEPISDEARQRKGSAIHRNTSVQSNRSAASLGSAEFEEDFGGNAFDESDFTHPDEVRIDDTAISNGPASPAQSAPNGQPQQHSNQRQVVPRTNSMPQMRPPNIQPPPAVQGLQAPQKPPGMQRPPMNAGQPPQRMLPHQTPGNQPRPQQVMNGQAQQNPDGSRSNPSSGTAMDSPSTTRQSNDSNGNMQQQRADVDNEGFPIPREPPQGLPGGFVTGRKAEIYNHPSDGRPPNANVAFNPHADSPSIRRTQGVNPGKSAPVSRMQINGGSGNAPAPAAQQNGSNAGFQNAAANGFNGAQRQNATNYVNPSADMNRRIGMPQQSGGPGNLQNRTGYRPPTAVKRPAMADVTNTFGVDGASDPKKTKLEGQGDTTEAGEQNGVAT